MENQNHNLATIEVIKDIQPIEGADRIECAFILGYKSVVSKGLHKINDKIIFIKPDSLVPRRSWSIFLFPKDDQNFDGPPIRIITRRFKKCVSQGLVLSLDILFENVKEPEFLEIGYCLDSFLDIEKYEKPVPAELAGTVKGHFPSFLKKTDELNLRSYPDAFNELKGRDIVIAIKEDGSSATFYYKDGVFGVCSRNLDLKETEGNAFWKIARSLDLENKLKQFGFNVALQGELFGPGINGNKMGAKEIGLKIFNVFKIDTREYFCDYAARDLIMSWHLPMVDIIYQGPSLDRLEDLYILANNSRYSNNEWAEGIVVRPVREVYSEVLDGRLSVKVINENFALKYKE